MIMNNIITREQLTRNGNAYLFQGEEYGGVPISFFLVYSAPGRGVSLHMHPYEEIFVVEKGQVALTIGDTTQEVHGGEIVVAPANTPHKFKNTGEEPLHMINIHPGKQVITQWLEE
jgi:mannose-6-phosphate isomerase-like protein (cupin superfamily)